MATPRKRFFTVECSLYREPWPRELKLTLVMLGMHMADRWAADALTPKQATIAHLSVGDLLTITGADSRDEALEILRQLSTVTSIKVQALDNGFTRIEWRKLAETQWSKSRNEGSKRGNIRATYSPKNAPSHPHPHPHSQEEEKRGADAPSPPVLAIADPPESKPPRRSRRVAETPPPEHLTDAERKAIAAWCRSRFRSLASRTVALEEACLDWARAKGVTRSDWPATVRTWIRKTAEDPKAMAAATANTGVPRAPIPDVREPGVDYEAERREILRLIEEKKRA